MAYCWHNVINARSMCKENKPKKCMRNKNKTKTNKKARKKVKKSNSA
jgi:hypothetical protein